MEEVTVGLEEKRCVPCRGGTPPLAREEAERLLAEVPGWTLEEDGKKLSRSFRLADFAAALALVERVARIAEAEDHHPDVAFGWGYCRLTFFTHAIGGLSESDFIMAAKVNTVA